MKRRAGEYFVRVREEFNSWRVAIAKAAAGGEWRVTGEPQNLQEPLRVREKGAGGGGWGDERAIFIRGG